MLSPAEMIVLKITTKRKLERKLIRALNDYLDIELIDVEQKGTGSSTSESELEGKILSMLTEISSALELLNVDPKKVVLSEKQRFDESSLESLVSEISTNLESIFGDVNKLKEKLNQLTQESNELNAIKLIAERLEPLGLNFELLHEGTHFYMVSGLVRKERLNRLEWNVKELTNNQYYFSSAPFDKNDYVVVVGVLKKFESDLMRILTSFGFSEFEIPKTVTGNPKDVLIDVNKKLQENSKEYVQWEQERERIKAKYQNKLIAIHEQLTIEKDRIEAKTKFRRTDFTVEIWGFIPLKQGKRAERVIRAIDPDALISIEDPHFDHSEYPTKLENPKIFKPFESLVYAYGAPTYHHDWDPTKIMAFTFPIFFGIMFGDFGHGLLLAILTYLGYKYNPEQGGIKGLLAQARPYLLVFTITSLFFGLMFGSFLGLEGGASPIPALWFDPVEESIEQFGGASGQFALLQLSFIIGNIHIISGLALMALNKAKHREYKEMIFFPVFLIIGYISALILVFSWGLDFSQWFSNQPGYFDIAIIPQLGYNENALIQFSSPLPFVALFFGTFFLFSLYMLFKDGMDGISIAIDFILTLISNSVSYARLFAILVVHGILAKLTVFIFASDLLHKMEVEHISYLDLLLKDPANFVWLTIWIIPGAALVMSLELIITSIQAIRLHWVEWFSKMHYEGNGRIFKPFKAIRKNTTPFGIEELQNLQLAV